MANPNILPNKAEGQIKVAVWCWGGGRHAVTRVGWGFMQLGDRSQLPVVPLWHSTVEDNHRQCDDAATQQRDRTYQSTCGASVPFQCTLHSRRPVSAPCWLLSTAESTQNGAYEHQKGTAWCVRVCVRHLRRRWWKAVWCFGPCSSGKPWFLPLIWMLIWHVPTAVTKKKTD